MDRRKVLGMLGGSMAVGLAGCINGDDGDDGNGNGNGNGDDDGPLISGAFEAESTDGRVLFGEPEKAEWDNDGGFGLPPSGQITEPVILEGELNDDGTWESTNIDFPPLDINLESVNPEVSAPNGFSGELDQEAELWTVEGQLSATAEIEGEEYNLTFPLNATTGESGELSGSYEQDGDTITATIVDNESIVEDTFGDDLIDATLGLPGSFEGDNWFTLTMELQNVDG